MQILDQKVQVQAKSKVGSLANVTHKAGGGDKKVFNDVEYLRQMSDTPGGALSNSASKSNSRRQSASQVSRKIHKTILICMAVHGLRR